MHERKEQNTRTWPLARDLLELEAELAACLDPRERRTILRQRSAVVAGMRERETEAEALAQLADFWGAIYGPVAGYLALFSGLRIGGKLSGTTSAFYRYPNHADEAARGIIAEAAVGREVYQCAHLVTKQRRRKEDAAPLAALYVDLDAPMPSEPLIEPTIMVESSPGHSQLYVRLRQPVAPERGAALNLRLAAALGGDPSGWDLTQLLRIPGTRNHKYHDRPLVRIVAQTNEQYDPRELEGFLPRLPAQPPRQPEPAPPLPSVGGDPPIPLTRLALRVWNGEDVRRTPDGRVDRSVSLFRLARLLYEAGLARDHIAAVLAERDVSLGWRKYADRDDAPQLYRRMVDVVAQGARTQHRYPER